MGLLDSIEQSRRGLLDNVEQRKLEHRMNQAQYNPVLEALENTLNDSGILPYTPTRHNIYTIFKNADWSKKAGNEKFNIYTELGLI